MAEETELRKPPQLPFPLLAVPCSSTLRRRRRRTSSELRRTNLFSAFSFPTSIRLLERRGSRRRTRRRRRRRRTSPPLPIVGRSSWRHFSLDQIIRLVISRRREGGREGRRRRGRRRAWFPLPIVFPRASGRSPAGIVGRSLWGSFSLDPIIRVVISWRREGVGEVRGVGGKVGQKRRVRRP